MSIEVYILLRDRPLQTDFLMHCYTIWSLCTRSLGTLRCSAMPNALCSNHLSLFSPSHPPLYSDSSCTKQLFQNGKGTPRKSNWDLRNCGKPINWSIQSRPLGFKRKTTCFSLRSVIVPTSHISYLSTFFLLAGSFISPPLKPRSLLALGGFRRLQC